MSDPDPDHVAVLARALHDVECVPLVAEPTAWTKDHNKRDQRKASRLADRLAGAGYTLTTTKDD